MPKKKQSSIGSPDQRIKPAQKREMSRLQFVQVVFQIWCARLQTLALAVGVHDRSGLVVELERIAAHDLPVVEDALWERLAARVRAQIGGEAEGLVDWQVGLDDEHGCAWNLHLFDDDTTTSVQATVDTTDGVFWTLFSKRIDS